jgi:predicted outer membrane repeat protein
LGGAIENSFANLTVDASVFDNNSANADGGAIAAFGSTNVINSTFSNNTALGAAALGGAIYFQSAGGAVIITESALFNNSAFAGGAVYILDGPVTLLRNVTISGNSARHNGGGLAIAETVPATFDLNNVTVTNNQAPIGGGIDVSSGSVVLRNTIVAGNTASAGSPDCSGSMTSQGHNLFGSTTGCTIASGAGDVMNASPLLGPLADNGGATMTHALRPGSPAIGTGDPAAPGSGGTACEATDQRGVSRPQGAACDIGAFEVSASTTTTTITTAITTTTTTTTTLPGCGVAAPTFRSIDCRLDLLIAQVQAATELANLENTLLKSLTQARSRELVAEGLPANKKKLAKKRLKEAMRKMVTFNGRVRSRAGRRKIPGATRMSLTEQGVPIQMDLQTLGKSL